VWKLETVKRATLYFRYFPPIQSSSDKRSVIVLANQLSSAVLFIIFDVLIAAMREGPNGRFMEKEGVVKELILVSIFEWK
jgi:hypothetical protein